MTIVLCNHDHRRSLMFALPAPASPEGTKTLTTNQTIKLDELGPMVVNLDGVSLLSMLVVRIDGTIRSDPLAH